MLLVLVPVLLTACGEQRPVDFVPGEDEPDQTIASFTLRQTEDGKLSWELVAELAYVWDQENLTVADTPHVDFYKDGEHQATLTAAEGTVNMLTNDMQARGGVVVVADDGARLTTEVLNWDSRRERLFTEQPVSYTRGGTTIDGRGFESDPDLTDWQINEPTGTISAAELGEETL
jgi:LPS export ABC transporter protein LptC